MTPAQIRLRNQLYHERKDRVFEVLAKCNQTMNSVKKCYKLAANYQDKIVLMGVDQQSPLKRDFEELNGQFMKLRDLIAEHSYPELKNLHDFVMNSQNDPRFTAKTFASAMIEAERKIKDIEQVLNEHLEQCDREYDRLIKLLRNQRRPASPKPKGDDKFLRIVAKMRISQFSHDK